MSAPPADQREPERPTLPENDERAVDEFVRFLERRTQHPEENAMQSYAAIFGELVYEVP